ncbi:hypothetical protein ASZ90_016118 [hydrocarbon metagenome]|uniref:Uncharacterized protein n=1 Tax=hydrocarbon metagenome TaxID=938273 RepID=A0A0W8F055_9ZZZZ
MAALAPVLLPGGGCGCWNHIVRGTGTGTRGAGSPREQGAGSPETGWRTSSVSPGGRGEREISW